MPTIAVVNQKGGVGKTAVTANLATVSARRGSRVLAVDLDPQYALTRQLVPDLPDTGLADVLEDRVDARDVIVSSTTTAADVIPSSRALVRTEIGLGSATRREERLGRKLDGIGNDYDVVLVDCPPNLGLLTVNALAVADHLLIPVSAEDEGAVAGVAEVIQSVREVYDGHSGAPSVSLVVTKYDAHALAASGIVPGVAQMGLHLHDAMTPLRRIHHQAPMRRTTVAALKPDSKSARSYEALFDELRDLVGFGLATH